jgi:DNA-binding MarR family transcriptional regulator
MAFASTPLKNATKDVTQRYYLGSRGIWILNLISIGITHPHELAEMLRVGRSLVSYELAQLTKAGLILARQGKRDRRHSELSLTPEGQLAFKEVRSALTRLVTDTLSHYTPEELRLCSRMLADLRLAMGNDGTPG